MRIDNVVQLIENGGTIELGPIGGVGCAAVASDGTHCLAMLVRDRNEAVLALLERLDEAIEDAIERQIYADEING